MKKSFITLAFIGVLIIGGGTTASAISTAELQAQISNLLSMVTSLQSQLTNTGGTPPAIPPVPQTFPSTPTLAQTERCLRLTDDLYYGMNDYHVSGAVSELQRFLNQSDLLNDAAITGFFGPQTMQAVRKFQANQGIATYGDPETTGYGRVGPSTRRAMQSFCNQTIPGTPQTPVNIYCTQDVKQCNNGSYVSRIAPTCAFAACPSDITTPTLTATPSDSPDGKVIIFTSTHGDISSYQPSHSDGQDTLIDFGDGSQTQWVQCQSSDTPSFGMHKCANPVTYKHVYKNAGTYEARLIRSGGFCAAPGCPITELAKVSVTVGNGTTACTKEYNPVCGQPQGCSACPAGAYCTMLCNQPEPKTYSNRCILKNTGARYLYQGSCRVITPTNTAPVIESFGGPTVLKVNETGTWKIEANDNENDSLTYRVDWGDQLQIPYDEAAPARIMQDRYYNQSTTFEHTYARAGKHTVHITVQDEQGLQTNTSTTVLVEETDNTTINTQCKSWYDGCNTCSRSYPGGPAMCTLRACYQQEPAYCKAYFNKTTSMCILEGDVSYAEGQSVQCIRDDNGYQSCIADASYVCRSGEWKIEGTMQYNPNPINYNTYDINSLIKDVNSGNADINQILNSASGFLQQYLQR